MLLNLLIAGAVASDNAAQTFPLLERRVPFFTFMGEDDFGNLCELLRTPCGEELSRIDYYAVAPRTQVPIKNARVRDILDKIADYRPGYKWSVSDGVIILSPNDASKTIRIDQKVARFEMRNCRARICIFNLAALFDIIVEGGDTMRYKLMTRHESDLENERATRTMDVDIHSLSLRDAFNKIVKIHGCATWRYLQRDPWYRRIFHWPSEREDNFFSDKNTVAVYTY
jgi:hypothetical protein